MEIIDYIIVCAFLVTTLVIGLLHGRKIKNISDYALGGRNFSTTAIVSTNVATWVSGSMFFIDLSNTYSKGLAYFIPSMCMPLQMFIIGYFLVPRMGEFLGNLSVAEAMGDLYGSSIRFITAFCGIVGSIGFIAVQFKVFGTLFHYFLGIPSNYAIYIASAIVIIYSAFGGIKSVTYTDVLQFFTFGFIIPTIGIIIWNHYVGIGLTYQDALASPIFNYKEVFDVSNVNFWGMIFLMAYFSFPTVDSTVFQRISIAKDVSQAGRALIIASVITAIVTIFVALIPFLIFNINPDLEAGSLLGYIIDNYTYTGFKGLIIIGIAAMAMSTADSGINATSVLFAHDITKLFNIKMDELLISKVFAFVLGGFAIYLALSKNDLLSIVMSSAGIYMGVVAVPLVFSIFGFRTSSIAVKIAMFGGFITLFTWQYIDTVIDDEIIPAMFVNAVLLFASHYLFKQPGGWVGIKDRSYLDAKKLARQKTTIKIITNIKQFSLMEFFVKNSPRNIITYSFFGVFCFISTIGTIYLTHSPSLTRHSDIVLAMYQSMMVTAVFFMLHIMWSPRIRNEKFVAVIWNFSLVYFLVICSTFFLLLSNIGKLQLVVFTLNLMVLFILVRWQISLIIIAIGVLIGAQFYSYYVTVSGYKGDLYMPDNYSSILYIFLLLSTALVAFLKPKQEHLEATEKRVTYLESELDTAHGQFNDVQGSMQLLQKQFEEKEGTLKEKEKFLLDQLKIRSEEVSKLSDVKDEFIRNLTHESNTPMTSILSLSDILYTYYDKLDKAEIKQSIKDIVKGGERLQTYINSITDLSKLSSLDYKLRREEVNLSQLVKERPFLYKKLFSDECEQQSFVFDVQPDISVSCDRYYITQVLDNLISNAVKYGRGNPVRISLRQNEQGKVSFEIRDEGIGIPTGELISIFDKFTVSSKTTSPAEGRGVGLALVNKIITMHDGRIWAESDGKSWSVFRVVL